MTVQNLNTVDVTPVEVHRAVVDTTIADETTELVEELAATAAINEAFTAFISNLEAWFSDLSYLSEDGNPVRTHMAIISVTEDVITEAQALRDKLIKDVAERGEEATEKGGLLRKQVIGEES